MIIYDNTGAILLDIVVDDSSVRYKAIKGDNVLTLRFSLAEHTEFPVGCWCEFKGEVYYLMASSDIIMNHRRDFDYTLMMYAIEAKAKLYKFVNPVDGRLKFPLTAYPKEHLQMFVDNMNSREDEGSKTWKIGECIEHERITLSYNHTFCYDALVQLAEELKLDFWFDGTTVSLGKLEINKDAPLPLSYGGDGEGLKPGIKRTNYSDALPIERLYVQGTEQNIDFSKYGSKELHLPKSMTIGYDGLHFEVEEGFDAVNARWYETDENGYSLKRSYTESNTLAEDSLDCSEIIPSKDEEVAQVIVVDEEKHFYDILFKSPVDYKTCQIAGETAYIVFQTGMLAGKELDLATNNDGVIICNKEGEYWRVEIAPQDIDGILMPDSSTGFIPQAGDTFKVFGVQLPSEYISDLTTRSGAEWDMFRYAVKHLYANEVPQYTIAGELDEIYAKRNWNSVKDKLVLGSYIAFSDRSIQEDALLIRIIGVKEYVNKPYSPRLELSNQVIGGTLTGALNRIENQEVYNEELYRKGISFSKRRFRDAKETISLLEKAVLDGFTETVSPIAVKTMSLLIGDESLQFRFVNSTESPERVDSTLRYDTLTKRVLSDAGIIQHMTLDIKQVSSDYSGNDYHFWNVSAFESEPMDADTPYYLYIKASTTSDEAEYILSDKAIGMRDVSGYYHFLTAILNKEFEGERSFVTLYGFTEVLPGQISTDIIRSADGQTYFDLVNGIISGKIRFESGSSGLENLPEWVEVKETAEEALEKAGSIGEEALAELEAYIDDVRQNLQEQIDGAVDSYFEDYEPSTTNYPAKDWSEEEKEAHLNDTFTNLTDGRSWRWSKSASVYTWVEIADTATSEALKIAGQAKDAADKKIRMFVEQPYPPYSVGDLWSRGEEAPLMRCINAKDSGAFDEADWGLADNSQAYTDEAVGNIKLGGDNLLRNSGFTGDYLSERIADDSVLEATDELYSAPLDHWSSSNATVVDSDETVSGKAVSLTSGEISQELYYNIIAGEQYTISFKAQGSGSISCTVADVTISVPLTEEWTKYERVVTINEPINAFRISNATCTLGDLKLESGNRASTWKPSFLDNSSDRAYWQSMKYMQSALKGATDVNGGLVLTEMIQVGDYDEESKTWRKRNGGMSGIYENDNDVAFWAGGNFEQAVATVMKYVEDPTYQPTEEELASMAKFVVTHGGNAIFNNAILRGIILAKGGAISGFKIEDDWLRAEGENYETIVSPARIAAKADGVELSTGTYKSLVNMQAYPGAGIPSVHMARVELTPSREFPEERAIAVYASAKGANTAKYDPAALGDYLGEYGGNYAFYSPYGMFAGLRPKCVVLSDGQTYRCSPVDHTLISNSVSGTNRIYLPEDPQDGQVIKIWKNNAHLLYLNTVDSKPMIRMNISSATEHGIETAFMGTIELIYHSEIGAWLMIIHETY